MAKSADSCSCEPRTPVQYRSLGLVGTSASEQYGPNAAGRVNTRVPDAQSSGYLSVCVAMFITDG